MRSYLSILLLTLSFGFASAQQIEETNQYLIEISGNGTADLAAAIEAAGGELVHDLAEIGAVSAVSDDPKFASRMGKAKGVKRITRDLMVQWTPGDLGEMSEGSFAAQGHITDPDTAFFRSCQWNLDQINASGAWSEGQFGAGTVVAVLDGGVSGDPSPAGGQCAPHVDLDGQLVGNVSMISEASVCDLFVPDQASGCDFRFHGTFVAGQIAAHGNAVAGIAPDSKIYGVKVLNCLGSGSFGDVIAGIIFAANQPEIDVINMSLGAYFPKNLPGAGRLVAAMNKAVNYAQGVKGKLVVSAAGNDGADLDHDGNFISVPAQSGSGLSAWAGDFNGDLASYSNHGVSGAQLGAGGGDSTPGVFIPACPLPASGHDGLVSVCSGDSLFFGCGSTSVLFNGSGTSFSAPIVAGVGALSKSKYPMMNGNQLQSHLKRTADDIGKKGADNDFGHGRVNANSATQ